LYEARAGLAAGKLVSVLLDDVELPDEYRGHQAVDLVRWQGDPEDPQLRRLIEFLWQPRGLVVGKGRLKKRIKIQIREDHATVLIDPGALSGFVSRSQLEARLWRSGPKSLLQFCDEHGEYRIQLRQEARRPFLRPPFLRGRYYDPEIQRFVPSVDFYHGRP
jgi:hypothetical protein